MVKVHESHFRLLAGEGALRLYQFHTKTAKHYFCGTCGIYPFHRKRVTPDHYGVNVFCLADFSPAGIPVRATSGASMDLLLPPAGFGGTAMRTVVVAGNASVNERSAAHGRA